MSAGLDARPRRLEGAGGGGAEPAGVLVLPAGVEIAGPEMDQLVAELWERIGRPATVVVVPNSGRDAVP